ncbi:unnamed protein product [Angiostrongylus costaricensis]|uniref:CASPASE_P10 domain-containing protein n=1 Tax=Angiostrongylus costaricensis TaxID=334426 RepID=A0A0R3PAQ6_ANGCS|nr:unnamed protein product [Angiostrongylus costaricensis]
MNDSSDFLSTLTHSQHRHRVQAGATRLVAWRPVVRESTGPAMVVRLLVLFGMHVQYLLEASEYKELYQISEFDSGTFVKTLEGVCKQTDFFADYR